MIAKRLAGVHLRLAILEAASDGPSEITGAARAVLLARTVGSVRHHVEAMIAEHRRRGPSIPGIAGLAHAILEFDPRRPKDEAYDEAVRALSDAQTRGDEPMRAAALEHLVERTRPPFPFSLFTSADIHLVQTLTTEHPLPAGPSARRAHGQMLHHLCSGLEVARQRRMLTLEQRTRLSAKLDAVLQTDLPAQDPSLAAALARHLHHLESHPVTSRADRTPAMGLWPRLNVTYVGRGAPSHADSLPRGGLALGRPVVVEGTPVVLGASGATRESSSEGR